MLADAIVTGLLKIARALGRWIVEHLMVNGTDMLLGYMNGKIGDFKRRLAKTRGPRRKRFISGRIRRWCAAYNWIVDRREALSGVAVRTLCAVSSKALARIPMISKAEAA